MGMSEVVRVLLAKRADVNAKSNVQGMTALKFVQQNKHFDVAQKLLAAGAKDEAADSSEAKTAPAGNTPDQNAHCPELRRIMQYVRTQAVRAQWDQYQCSKWAANPQ